jgi:hypothetical protein
MNTLEFLGLFSDSDSLSNNSRIVAFAYYLRRYKGQVEFTSSDIRECFRESLLRNPQTLSSIINSLSLGDRAPLLPGSRAGRFSLSVFGLREVEGTIQNLPSTPERTSEFLQFAIPYLQKSVAKLSDDNQRKFLAEAIACIGAEARQATIIMTWLVAIDHLYDYIITHKLAEINSAISRRTDRISTLVVSTKDDFLEIKESVFIEVARSADIITNDVRKILEEKLGIRNSCAHPSTIEIHDSKVVSFIEDMVDNVIVKYPL